MSQGIHNPFAQLLVAFQSRYLYGREDQLSTMLNLIGGRDLQPCWVVGIRKIGKTALMQSLRDLLYTSSGEAMLSPNAGTLQLLPVYIPFKAMPAGQDSSIVLRTVLKFLYREVVALPVGDPSNPPPLPAFPLLDAKNSQEIQQDLLEITDWLTHKRNRVVYLFDDFHIALDRSEPLFEETIDRLALMASFVMSLDYVGYLSLHLEIPKSLQGYDSKMLRRLREEGLPLLGENAAEQLIRLDETEAPLEWIARRLEARTSGSGSQSSRWTPPELNDDERKLLLEIGGTHPGVLTAVCSEYLKYRGAANDATRVALAKDPQAVSAASDDFISYLLGKQAVTDVLDAWWNEAEGMVERQALNAIATHTPLKSAGSIFGWPASITQELDTLYNKRIINKRDGEYFIPGKVFERYIEIAYPRWAEQRHPTVSQMRDYITRKLGGTDQRLFEYLSNRANQLCSYEDILDAVWQDRTSLRALNASITRLRNALTQMITNDREYIVNERSKGYSFLTNPPISR